jgi:hypothetical protein
VRAAAFASGVVAALIADSFVAFAAAIADLKVFAAASCPVRYVAIADLNATISGLGVCVLVVGAAVSAATAVPVLAIKPAATNNPTFFADMNFIIFSPNKSY